MKALVLMMAAATFAVSANHGSHDHHDSTGHAAHEHGHGQLNLVLDGNLLLLELSAPAADLVGFEHAAQNDDEKARMAQAMDRLKQAETLFVLAPGAGCTLALQEIKAGHDEHDHDGDHHHDEPDDHADVAASYSFTCTQPDALKGMRVSLFAHYPSLSKLTVQGLIPGGQLAGELTPSNPTLEW